MHLRRDAGLVAGDLMSQLRALPEEIEGLRLTIGSVSYQPNLISVIANTVQFTVDARHPDREMLGEAERRINSILSPPTCVCDIASESLARVEPLPFSGQVVQAVQQAADDLGLTSKRMISGAGHDAQILGSRYPSGMIFIPSRDGISHNVTEYSSPEQVANGANVLLHALLNLIRPV